MKAAIDMCTDALLLNAHHHNNIEQIRRDQLKYFLDKDQRILAKDVNPTDVHLFGDDLNKRLSEIETDNKIKGIHSFNNRNFKRPFNSNYNNKPLYSKNFNRFQKPENPVQGANRKRGSYRFRPYKKR